MLLQFIDFMLEYESHPDIRQVLPDMLIYSKNNANQILYMHAVWMDVEVVVLMCLCMAAK